MVVVALVVVSKGCVEGQVWRARVRTGTRASITISGGGGTGATAAVVAAVAAGRA